MDSTCIRIYFSIEQLWLWW